MNEKYMLYSSIAIISAMLIYVSFSLVTGYQDNPISSFQTITTGTTDSGDVSIELTPKINNGKLEAEIAANTHSVDLSQFDLTQITTLEYGNKIAKPISAPTLEGHHTTGTLIFPTDENIKSFKITIKGIPITNERTFIW